MSWSRIIVLAAIFSFALGLVSIDDAVAGEKIKLRSVWYSVKNEAVEVGDEEEHWVGVYDLVGIRTVLEGNPSQDGAHARSVGVYDIYNKTKVGSLHGYVEITDKDGDKIYATVEGKPKKEEPGWEGEALYLKGTGKFEGIKGKSTWSSHPVAENQSYTDVELEIE